MTAGALITRASTGAPANGQPGPRDRVEPYRWPVALVLHLVPGMLVMAGYLALLPAARAADLPPGLALTAAMALIGVPLELGFLVYARRRQPAGLVTFRRRLPAGHLAAVTASCLAVAAGLYLWLAPLAGTLERTIFGWLPQAWFVTDGGLAVGRDVLAATLLVSLLVDGLISPAVQEIYYRGHLMARLPVAASSAGWLIAPAASAALFAAQHLWQPQLVVIIFAVQTMVGVVVWRTRCLAVAIVVHSACNILAVTLTLLPALVGG